MAKIGERSEQNSQLYFVPLEVLVMFSFWYTFDIHEIKIKNNGSDIIYGIGASYNITDSFSLKIEYLNSQVNKETANPFSIGFDIIF